MTRLPSASIELNGYTSWVRKPVGAMFGVAAFSVTIELAQHGLIEIVLVHASGAAALTSGKVAVRAR